MDVERIMEVIRSELERQSNEADGPYYRREDDMVDGRVDMEALAKAIIADLEMSFQIFPGKIVWVESETDETSALKSCDG